MKDKLLTLEETADLLRVSVPRLRHIWPTFTKQGVRPIRFNGTGRRILFRESEINRMVETWEVG